MITFELHPSKFSRSKYPSLRVDEEGNVYLFTRYAGAAPMVASNDGEPVGDRYTSGDYEDYKEFHGSITLTQD